MAPAAVTPPKRILADSTDAHRNDNMPHPLPKKRKLEVKGPNGAAKHLEKTKLGSSQPKSQFEEDVLEKLTQDINGLKDKNSEKDQQWARPPLHDFDPEKDNLCFQQIEVEEGTLHGGKVAIKLFGVTEVG